MFVVAVATASSLASHLSAAGDAVARSRSSPVQESRQPIREVDCGLDGASCDLLSSLAYCHSRSQRLGMTCGRPA